MAAASLRYPNSPGKCAAPAISRCYTSGPNNYNLTRRVIAITDHSDARLVLAVERFGRSRPDRLEFVRIEFERSARELSREEFCDRLKELLACQFPDETVESATNSADLEHSLSGNYVRALSKRRSR
jgi:hypothetical protein